MQSQIQCYCGSSSTFNTCCEPIVNQLTKASTAEQLMRSRYSAFCLGNVAYLLYSHHPKTANTVEVNGLLEFCRAVQFYKLNVVKTKKGQLADVTGRVKFKAFFKQDGVEDIIAEDSYFERVDGEWKYKNGKSF